MAFSNPIAETLLSKRVQEIVISADEPPAPFVCRNESFGTNEDPTEDSPIPVINIACFLPGKHSDEDNRRELEKLKSALSTWGCFQAIGHGIPISFLDAVLQVGREFFEQPMEEKNKYAKELNDFEGYGGDPVPEEGQSLDWSDRIYLELIPEDARNYRLWPHKPNSFKQILEEYTREMIKMTEVISKGMARSLNLEENCFIKQFGERAQLAGRFNYYSTCKWADLVLGLKPHADGSGYTVILQDEPGLQILNNGEWFTVPKNSQALLVLMGDQMVIMSNGIFKSAVHRVISSAEKDRISVAAFYTPEIGKEIGPEEELISTDVPRMFKRVRDYSDTHFNFYLRGLRSLHTVQLQENLLIYQ